MRFPKAERFASIMRLPLVVDPATKELYGYAVPVLDDRAAARVLCKVLRTPVGSEEFQAAMAILEERVEALQ